MADFRPVVYLKDTCPWCLKLQAGLKDAVEERFFAPGDAAEGPIRAIFPRIWKR
jgi:hypothetical protein